MKIFSKIKTAMLLTASLTLIGCGGGGGGGSTPSVSDTIAPIVVLKGAAVVTLNVGDTYTESGATATDNVDGTLSVSTTGSVNMSTAGIYTLTYSATDKAGNKGTKQRQVNVNAVTKIDQNIDAGADVGRVYGNGVFIQTIENNDLGTGAISCSSSDVSIATVVANGDSCEVTLVEGRDAKYSFTNQTTITVTKAADSLYNQAVDTYDVKVVGVVGTFVGFDDIQNNQCVKYTLEKGMALTEDGVGQLDLNHPDGKINLQTGNTNVNHLCVKSEGNRVFVVAMGGKIPVWNNGFGNDPWDYAAIYEVNSDDRRILQSHFYFRNDLATALNTVGIIWTTITGNQFKQKGGPIASLQTVTQRKVDYLLPSPNEFGTAGTTLNDCRERTVENGAGQHHITTLCKIKDTRVIVKHIPEY